jgi:transposase
MAVAHSILVIAYHLMADPEATYTDLGPDRFARRNDPDARQETHRTRLPGRTPPSRMSTP